MLNCCRKHPLNSQSVIGVAAAWLCCFNTKLSADSLQTVCHSLYYHQSLPKHPAGTQAGLSTHILSLHMHDICRRFFYINNRLNMRCCCCDWTNLQSITTSLCIKCFCIFQYNVWVLWLTTFVFRSSLTCLVNLISSSSSSRLFPLNPLQTVFSSNVQSLQLMMNIVEDLAWKPKLS